MDRNGGNASLPLNAEQSQQMLEHRQRNSIPSFLFLMLILFLITSHNGDEFLARHQYQDALTSLKWQLSNYTAWMNGTESNFTMPNEDLNGTFIRNAILPPAIVPNPDHLSYYSNITGFMHGDADFYNISQPTNVSSWTSAAEAYMTDFNITEAAPRMGEWNWTASEKLSISLAEKLPDPIVNNTENIAIAHGRIEFTDTNSAETIKLEFEAIHFVNNGSLYGFAEPSGRHIDIRLLPSLVPEFVRNATARVLEPELSARIAKLENLIDAGIVEQDSALLGSDGMTTCPFVIYAQVDTTYIPADLMQELEQEIQRPTGVSTVSQPPLSLQAVIISRECGLLYNVHNTDGLKAKTFFRKLTTYSGIAAIIYLILLVEVLRQMDRSRTPVGLSSVSRWTFFTQSTMDAVSFAGHITVAIVIQGRTSMALVAPAFIACVLFVYETQFSVLVQQVQLSEAPSTPAPVRLAPAATLSFPSLQPTAPVVITDGTEGARPPLPATAESMNVVAANPHPPLVRALWQHVRTDPQARLWFLLFLFLMFIVRVILSPNLSLIIIGFTYSLIWFPQIFRSMRQGRSSGLSKEYIILTTAGRLYLALYFFMCPKNVLDVQPRNWAPFLAIFVCFQASIVILQDILDPAFFVPKRFRVKRYDYHPPLSTVTDIESPDQSLGDCVICMEPIFAETRQSEEKGSGGESGSGSFGLVDAAEGLRAAVGHNRKEYSLAPCHHLFHTHCLKRWLDLKNICPQCRRPLPPI